MTWKLSVNFEECSLHRTFPLKIFVCFCAKRHFFFHNLFKVYDFQVFFYFCFCFTFALKGLCKTAGAIFILYTYIPEDFNNYSSKFAENIQVIVLKAQIILNINCGKTLNKSLIL